MRCEFTCNETREKITSFNKRILESIHNIIISINISIKKLRDFFSHFFLFSFAVQLLLKFHYEFRGMAIFSQNMNETQQDQIVNSVQRSRFRPTHVTVCQIREI